MKEWCAYSMLIQRREHGAIGLLDFLDVLEEVLGGLLEEIFRFDILWICLEHFPCFLNGGKVGPFAQSDARVPRESLDCLAH